MKTKVSKPCESGEQTFLFRFLLHSRWSEKSIFLRKILFQNISQNLWQRWHKTKENLWKNLEGILSEFSGKILLIFPWETNLKHSNSGQRKTSKHVLVSFFYFIERLEFSKITTDNSYLNLPSHVKPLTASKSLQITVCEFQTLPRPSFQQKKQKTQPFLRGATFNK